MEYVYTEHSITDTGKLKLELIAAGDVIPIFAINTDVFIESSLSKAIVDQVVIDAGD